MGCIIMYSYMKEIDFSKHHPYKIALLNSLSAFDECERKEEVEDILDKCIVDERFSVIEFNKEQFSIFTKEDLRSFVVNLVEKNFNKKGFILSVLETAGPEFLRKKTEVYLESFFKKEIQEEAKEMILNKENVSDLNLYANEFHEMLCRLGLTESIEVFPEAYPEEKSFNTIDEYIKACCDWDDANDQYLEKKSLLSSIESLEYIYIYVDTKIASIEDDFIGEYISLFGGESFEDLVIANCLVNKEDVVETVLEDRELREYYFSINGEESREEIYIESLNEMLELFIYDNGILIESPKFKQLSATQEYEQHFSFQYG